MSYSSIYSNDSYESFYPRKITNQKHQTKIFATSMETKETKTPCPCLSSGKTDVTVTAAPAEPCNCVPYNVLCCCGPINGISVIQPACQTLPDGRVVNNPAYVAANNRSYWTYKFMTDCNSSTRAISNIGIPICNLIIEENLIVSEKINGCGTFTPVPFELTTSDPNLGSAPEGFQFVKVETDERYEKGVCVEYRLEIVGDYPTAIEPITLKAGDNILTFNCECFLVPACNPQGSLSLTKECDYIIQNNSATFLYNLTVINTGDSVLTNVLFTDTILIPNNVTIGPITVTPNTLTVDTSIPGQVTISGNLGTLNPGGQILITYSFQVTGITAPGSYTFSNTALVSSTGTQASATCSTTLEAVLLDTTKCCQVVNSNTGIYRFIITSIGNSPSTTVDVSDSLFIPSGVTLQFTSFSDCIATFAGTDNPVPLNTNVTGPLRINIQCNSLLVPHSGSAHQDISFILVSSSAIGTSIIENTISSVTPTNPDTQIILGVGAIPQTVDMNVILTLECTDPC